MTMPLEGLLVADFSRVLAGPLATATLADLGARVVKVERPGTGDDTRSWGPPWTSSSSAYFESCNRNKESVVLDLAEPHDRGLAQRLARRADVLVENFRTGTLEKYGLGYDQVASDHPGIVYCSITGFGSGHGAALPGYDFLVQAVGGLMSVTGAPDGEPMKVGVALVDVLTSKDAVSGILAALHSRHRDGIGQHVEVNLLSSLLTSLVNQASSYLTPGGASSARLGNAHPSIAPYELLRTGDDYLALACGNDRQFRQLSIAVGDPSLADDPRYATNAARVANRATLVADLEALLAADSAVGWTKRLTDVGVPAGQVGDLAGAFALAEELGLAPVVEVGDGRPAQVRHPVTYSAHPVTAYAPPPHLGQHSDEVRRWLEKDES